MSAPQRSHFIASSAGAGGAGPSAETTGFTASLCGDVTVGGTFVADLSTAVTLTGEEEKNNQEKKSEPQTGSARSFRGRGSCGVTRNRAASAATRRFADSAAGGPLHRDLDRDLAEARGVLREAKADSGYLEMTAASAAATSVIVTTKEPRVTRRVITMSYSPHPIWFATNQRAIIETGTPSNHATPYFITPLLSNNFVIQRCNMHSKVMWR